MSEPTKAARRAAGFVLKAYYSKTEIAEVIDRETHLPELIEALRPFAEAGRLSEIGQDNIEVRVIDCHRARAVLAEVEGE